jgi:hypothetical protein
MGSSTWCQWPECGPKIRTPDMSHVRSSALGLRIDSARHFLAESDRRGIPSAQCVPHVFPVKLFGLSLRDLCEARGCETTAIIAVAQLPPEIPLTATTGSFPIRAING